MGYFMLVAYLAVQAVANIVQAVVCIAHAAFHAAVVALMIGLPFAVGYYLMKGLKTLW